MKNILHQYGETILYLLCAFTLLSFIIFNYASGKNNSFLSNMEQNYYIYKPEIPNTDYVNIEAPTITLKSMLDNETKCNIHVSSEENGAHNFKEDIVLIDKSASSTPLDSNLVSYRVLSTKYKIDNPDPGYYLIKFWYRSRNTGLMGTLVVTVVVH